MTQRKIFTFTGGVAISFNRADWKGKLLYVYFNTTSDAEGNWKVDAVTFQQQRSE
jgi:hypothetical protein